MNKEKKQEFTVRISQANKTQLAVILYDMTLTYLEDALEAWEKSEKKEYKLSLERAKSCVDELLGSLHLEYEPAAALKGLYFFYKRELTTAAVREKPELIGPVAAMIKELKAAYETIASQDTSASLMENAQSVYTGFTYGKDSQGVTLADQNLNRGFIV